MVGCACIPPPPSFDLPPPPDPSLVWHLLSDEPADPLKEIQQCESKSEEPNAGTLLSASRLLTYLPFILLAFAALLSLLLVVTVLLMRIRRVKAQKRTQFKKKSECAADVILNGDRGWSYGGLNSTAGSHIFIYGQPESVVTNAKPLPTGTSSMRSVLRRPAHLGVNSPRTQLRQSSTTLRLHGNCDGYCTVGRMYEEIPPKRSDSAAAFEDINSINDRQLNALMYPLETRESVRRPPPQCRPPSPPSQESPLSSEESSMNSIERELEQIHNSPSPKRSIEEDRKSRHSGENGRESGYGTAPSRLWNSPRLPQRHRDMRGTSTEHSNRQIPLAVFAQQSCAHTMTYV